MDRARYALLVVLVAMLIGFAWLARRRARECPQIGSQATMGSAPLGGLALLPAKPPFAAVLSGRGAVEPVGPIALSRLVPNVIGSDPHCCNILVDDRHISRRHAQVLWEEKGFVIHDLGSTDGTYVNRRRVRVQPLVNGDVVQLGDTTLLFRMDGPDVRPTTGCELALCGPSSGIQPSAGMPGLPGRQPGTPRTKV